MTDIPESRDSLLFKELRDVLIKHNFDMQQSYHNGIEGIWAMNKDRDIEITIKVNEMPDEEEIDEFNTAEMEDDEIDAYYKNQKGEQTK